MSVAIEIKSKGLDKVKKRIGTITDKIKNKRSLLEKISVLLFKSVMENFREQGTDKEKWQPLSLITRFIKKYRLYKKTSKPMLLQDTGMLRGSIIPEVGDNYAKVGTNIAYARLHQFGGVSSPGEVVIGAHQRKTPSGGTTKVREYIMRLKGGHKIPARPFLTLRDKYKNNILNLCKKFYFENREIEG